MNLRFGDDILEFERGLRAAVEAAGGDALVHEAERAPRRRAELVEPLLAPLGVWDLAPRKDAIELEAAAVACRVAGRYALPYPVAERLARLPDTGDGLVVVSVDRPVANVAGVDLDWMAIDLDGRRARCQELGRRSTSRLDGFTDALRLGVLAPGSPSEAALALVLPCWALLGMLDRSFELVHQHCLDREQFGKRLADFQVVQFQLADALVAVQGLEEVAKYALWATLARPDDALTDALGLRLTALDAATAVMRTSHQLHGALGFCDETTLSWLSRHSQPYRRQPFGAAETEEHFTRLVDAGGLRGLYL